MSVHKVLYYCLIQNTSHNHGSGISGMVLLVNIVALNVMLTV